jgi:hypothetical protein
MLLTPLIRGAFSSIIALSALLFMHAVTSASTATIVSLSTDNTSYVPGDPISISWSSSASNANDWITITPRGGAWTSALAGAGANTGGKGLYWVSSATSGTATLIAPANSGNYDIVYYASATNGSFASSVERVRVSISVTEPTDCASQSASQVPIEVIQVGGVPNTDTHSLCREFPFTSVARIPTPDNMAWFSATTASIQKYAFLWANRCNGGPVGKYLCDDANQGNPPTYTIGSSSYRFFFTTVARADACTMAQVYSFSGDSALATSTLSGAGVQRLNTQTPSAQLVSGKYTDVCWLYAPAGSASQLDGLLLDYEVADNRTMSQALGLLRTFADYVYSKGQRSLLYVNGIASAAPGVPYVVSDSAQRDGIGNAAGSTIAPQLLKLFDVVGLEASGSKTPSEMQAWLAAQMSEYAPVSKADHLKIFAQVQIGTSTSAQMAAVHQFVVDNQLGGIHLWNNFASWSSYQNFAYRQARCLVYGTECDTNTVGNALPMGVMDSATTSGLVRGWAADPDVPRLALNVDFYTADSGAYIGSAIANQPHQDVSGMSLGGGHGFAFQLPSADLSAVNELTVYATDPIGGQKAALATTIDQSSVTNTARTPIITGNSSASSIYVLIYSNSGIAVYGSSLIFPNRQTAQWKVTVWPPLSVGTYQVHVLSSASNATLASETLTITQE